MSSNTCSCTSPSSSEEQYSGIWGARCGGKVWGKVSGGQGMCVWEVGGKVWGGKVCVGVRYWGKMYLWGLGMGGKVAGQGICGG